MRFEMGSSVLCLHPEFPTRPDVFEVDTDNGYVINNVLLNDDVLTMILSHISPRDLVASCRLVCKSWCNLIDANIWKMKLNALPYGHNEKVRNLPWHWLYWIIGKNFLYTNLILNPCGKNGFDHWTITRNGGNKFVVEQGTYGTATETPHGSCFTTSFGKCTKTQELNLHELGAKPYILDMTEPEIEVSEWYAGRWDCRALYEMEVKLLDSRRRVIAEFSCAENCGGDYGSDWRQVKHTFRKYGPELHYISFSHSGVDRQFWAGHYGSKMTGACVKLKL